MIPPQFPQVGDLPVEEGVKFEVVINVRAAQALVLTIPASLCQDAELVEPL
jgi:hypothetical protein